MRLLIDNCLPRGLAEKLSLAGHDLVWAGEWGRDPGDEQILARAAAERRVLVTLDKGFGKLMIAALFTRSGVLLMRRTRPPEWFDVCHFALELCAADLRAGAIVLATPKGIRVRHLPGGA